jgi:hypothetical protein
MKIPQHGGFIDVVHALSLQPRETLAQMFTSCMCMHSGGVILNLIIYSTFGVTFVSK